MKLDPEEKILLNDDQLEKIDEICQNPPELTEHLKKFIEKMDKAYPFKRVSAPKHLIDRWNEEVGSKNGQEMREIAFTVNKDAEIDDDMIWDMMTKTATDMERESNPPHTGKEKKKLV